MAARELGERIDTGYSGQAVFLNKLTPQRPEYADLKDFLIEADDSITGHKLNTPEGRNGPNNDSEASDCRRIILAADRTYVRQAVYDNR